MYVGTGGADGLSPPGPGLEGGVDTGRALSVAWSSHVMSQCPLTIVASVMVPFSFHAPKVPAAWPWMPPNPRHEPGEPSI